MSSEVMSVMARLEGDAGPFVRAFKSGEESMKSLDTVLASTSSSVDKSMQDAGRSFDDLGDDAEDSAKDVDKSGDKTRRRGASGHGRSPAPNCRKNEQSLVSVIFQLVA